MSANVTITTSYADTDYKSYPVAVQARELLHGALDIDELSCGWLQPWRFLPVQRQALTSCSAWYPGIYRQMAACTAGMELSFTTNCSFVHIELSLEPFSKATLDVLGGMSTTAAPVKDELMLELDGGEAQALQLSEFGKPSVLEVDFGTSLVGSVHTVRLWLPALRAAKLRYVCAKGGSSKELYVRPLTYEKQLLVLGDSVAQGFCAEQPQLAWPALVARQLKAELINQSVGAQVFQPAALMGLEGIEALKPDVVVVALGANYKYGRCIEHMIAREISAYINQVAKMWPSAALLIVAPNKQGVVAVKGSCFERVPALITHAYQHVREQRLKNDNKAPVALKTAPELKSEFLADADGHPTVEGAAQLAEFVLAELAKFGYAPALEQKSAQGKAPAKVEPVKPASSQKLEQQPKYVEIPAKGAEQ